MLAWPQLRQLFAAGIEVGSHGLEHVALDELGRAEIDRQVRLSKSTLEDGLGRPVQAFSYPHGYFDDRVIEAVRAAGFAAACTVGHRLSAANEDRFRLSRVVVYGATPIERFGGWLDGSGLRPASPGILRTGWRVVRRLRARGSTGSSGSSGQA